MFMCSMINKIIIDVNLKFKRKNIPYCLMRFLTSIVKPFTFIPGKGGVKQLDK